MDFDVIKQEALAWLGQLILYGGGSTAIAYGAFVFFGKRWIEHKFSEQLEKNKHAQAKELEGVKFKINSLFNRVAKMQEKEFEVLPIAWERLQDCCRNLEVCGFGFQRYLDFNKKPLKEIEGYLEDANFPKDQINEVCVAEDKNKAYSKILRWRQIDRLNKSYDSFYSYLEKNRIFVSTEVRDKFLEIREIMWELIISINYDGANGLWGDSIDKYAESRDDLRQLMDKIEALMRPRLYAQESIFI